MSHDNEPKTIGDCKRGQTVTTIRNQQVRILGPSEHAGWVDVVSGTGPAFQIHKTCRLKAIDKRNQK